MAIEGNLQDMALPNLLQFVAKKDEVVCVQLRQADKQAELYINGRNLCHAFAANKDGSNPQQGEEVLYELLTWKTGEFVVKRNPSSIAQTLDVSWEYLLMEGLRRLDENQASDPSDEQPEETLSEMLADLSKEDAEAIHGMIAQQENNPMADINTTLNEIMQIDGAIAAAIVDWQSGLTLGTIGAGFDIDLAAAGNTNVVRSKLGVMKDLKINGTIEDILITLTDQYHLIRLLSGNQQLFIYVALRRASANLGLARHRLAALEKDLTI
ncbi:MAG: DUF4388 domain-containing protein [Anaerolineales bacterium]|nr:DUF4388 domain-containing protein [Anaerolineales bacterium]